MPTRRQLYARLDCLRARHLVVEVDGRVHLTRQGREILVPLANLCGLGDWPRNTVREIEVLVDRLHAQMLPAVLEGQGEAD